MDMKAICKTCDQYFEVSKRVELDILDKILSIKDINICDECLIKREYPLMPDSACLECD